MIRSDTCCNSNKFYVRVCSFANIYRVQFDDNGDDIDDNN